MYAKIFRNIAEFFYVLRLTRPARIRSPHGCGSAIVESLEDRVVLSAIVLDMTATGGGLTATQLAQSLVGTGVTISNATFTGNAQAGGSFSGGNSDGLGIDQGVVFSTGKVINAPGPNTSTGITTDFAAAGDTDLTALAGTNTNDASILQFDFVPSSKTISFD